MSVKVIGTVTHSGEKNFPVFIDSDGRVAFCIVADITARDAIATYRRVQGLHAYVISENSTYVLGADLTTWALKDASSYILSSEKGAANGVAPLNANGKIDGSYLQSLFINAAIGVADIAEMLATSSVAGNLFVVEDTSGDPPNTGAGVYYKNNNDDPSDLADFLRLDFGSSVISVNGQQGVVTISISSLLSDPTNVTDFNTQVAASDYALSINSALSDIQGDITQLESDVAELQLLDIRFRGEFVFSTLYNAGEYVVDTTADGKALFKVLITNDDVTTDTITHFEKVKEYYTVSETDALLADKADLVSGKVPVGQLPLGDISERIFDDYAALIAATGVQTGELVYVKDASGDPSITEGSAKYSWNGSTWVYIEGSNIVPYSTFQTAQGLSASATQPGDNISTLTNDAGYTNYTTANFNTDLATKSLDDINEGVTNVHFTSADNTKLDGIEPGAEVNEVNEAPIDGQQYVRQDGAWAQVDIPEGYTSTDFDVDFATKTTDDLTEGITNKYLTGNEFQKNLDDLDDITEGTANKHFTATEKTKLSNIDENANNYSHPNHTGDVTSTGDGATVIANDVVTNEKLANMATKTYKGRTSASTGDPEDVTISQLKADLGLAINVDDYGAVGDGVTDDTLAIQAAATAANAGSKILVFTGGKTYRISRRISLGNITIIGHQAIVIRDDQTVTTLTSPAVNGTTILQVNDASGFQIGDLLFLTDTTGVYGGIALSESSLTGTSGTDGNVISNISGNTITISTPLNLPSSGNLNVANQYPIGAPVYRAWDMFTGGNVKVYGLTFDGNKDNNTGTVAWTVWNCFFCSENSLFDGCTFINMPTECIFHKNKFTFVNNIVLDCLGSATHISDGNPVDGETSIYANNRIERVCLAPLAAAVHNEAVFCTSANTTRQLIIGNTIYDCGGAISGDNDSSDDFQIEIKNNFCENLDGIFFYRSSNNIVGYDIDIDGNYFKNCVRINFTTTNSTIQKNGGFDKIKISNNNFINCDIRLDPVSNAIITGNSFLFEEGYVLPVDSRYTSGNSVIVFNGANIIISDNLFENRRVSENGYWLYAMLFPSANTTILIKSDSITNTDYSYFRNIKVTNNQILGFSCSFTVSRTADAGVAWSHSGCEFSNNICVAKDGIPSNDPRGEKVLVKVLPGFVVENNKLYGNTSYAYGLYAMGVSSDKATVLNGPICINNTIINFNESARLGRSAGLAATDGNCIVFKGNYISKPLDNFTNVANSFVSDNTTIINETPRLDIVRANSGFY